MIHRYTTFPDGYKDGCFPSGEDDRPASDSWPRTMTTPPAPEFESHIRIMPASTPHLTEFPIETLERIALHLPAQDIIKMDLVRELVTKSARFCVDLSVA